MKVLVRNRATGQFLKGQTLWTYNAVEAREFVSCPNAMNRACALGATNAGIVLSFGDSGLSTRISPHHMQLLQPTRPRWA